jgi:hypothetical protein
LNSRHLFTSGRRGFRLALVAIAAILLCDSARGQLTVPAGTNLFGDEFVCKLPKTPNPLGDSAPDTRTAAPEPRPRSAGYGQVLLFQNHRQLRGELVSLDKGEIVWSRPDASEPLRFQRAAVRRILLNPAGGATPSPIHAATDGSGNAAPPIRATVQLPGADWLFGDLTSHDGQNFDLRIGAQANFALRRAEIGWLYFDTVPAPTGGFAGSVLDLETWTGPAASGRLRVEDGALITESGRWLGKRLGRTTAGPPRFAIDFTIPGELEENSVLWLQPGMPQGDLVLGGTVQLGFGPDMLSHSILDKNVFDDGHAPLPDGAKGGHGLVRYRVLYDRPGNRLAVLRNGHRAAELKLHSEPDKNAAAVPTQEPDPGLQSVCFSRTPNGWNWTIQLSRLRIAPWDGVLPDQGEPAPADDLWSLGADPPAKGKLEAVGRSSVTFSGAEKPIAAGLFLQFANQPPPLADPDCRLLLGDAGELNVAGLRIAAGRVHGRTALAAPLDLPIEALQTITLPLVTPASGAPPDLLVFKDGDELEGALLAAASGERLRWRTADGQEVDFDTGRLAGVRFPTAEKPAPAAGSAVVELSNGDLFSGAFGALDERALKIIQPRLGAISIERSKVRKLYSEQAFPVFDGAFAAAAMGAAITKTGDADSSSSFPEARWIYLDGAFIPRGDTDSTVQSVSSLHLPLHCTGNLFEIDCDVTQSRVTRPRSVSSYPQATAMARSACTGTPQSAS